MPTFSNAPVPEITPLLLVDAPLPPTVNEVAGSVIFPLPPSAPISGVATVKVRPETAALFSIWRTPPYILAVHESLRRRPQSPSSEPMRRAKVVPPSGTATVDDDQLNLPSAATPLVVKNHVPGVAL